MEYLLSRFRSEIKTDDQETQQKKEKSEHKI